MQILFLGLWKWKEEQSSSTNSVNSTYENEGVYVVQLTATNGICTDTYNLAS
jgi:PKD repeat protein